MTSCSEAHIEDRFPNFYNAPNPIGVSGGIELETAYGVKRDTGTMVATQYTLLAKRAAVSEGKPVKGRLYRMAVARTKTWDNR